MNEQELQELGYVRHIGPLPLFWGAETDSMKDIEEAGFQDYYLLAQEKIALPPQQGKAQEYAYRPTIFLITKTIMGRAVTLAEPKDINLFQSTNESAQYFMPKMPWEMVQKMDAFFRLTYKKHGSEAILVLTYDMDYVGTENPSAGWNCIAPKQKNTAGNCDYEPDSILQYKKDSELILGTIHSHPEMSAYFSSTDHKDQDEWDGIHITQAWKGTGPTEYYIAMILGGQQWVLKPEQVFDTPPLPQVDTTQVETWMENVEKKAVQPAPMTQYGKTYGTTGTSNPPLSLAMPLPTQGFMPADKVRAIKLPANAPDPETTVIIPEYPASILTDTVLHKCRLCNAPLLAQCVNSRRCVACTAFMLIEGESVKDLEDYRNNGKWSYSLYIDLEKSPNPISIYYLDETFSDDQRIGAYPKV